jgi:hypothetical protein
MRRSPRRGSVPPPCSCSNPAWPDFTADALAWQTTKSCNACQSRVTSHARPPIDYRKFRYHRVGRLAQPLTGDRQVLSSRVSAALRAASERFVARVRISAVGCFARSLRTVCGKSPDQHCRLLCASPRSHPRKRGPCSTFRRALLGRTRKRDPCSTLRRALLGRTRKRAPAQRSGAPTLGSDPRKSRGAS